jgi:hypothetical protein
MNPPFSYLCALWRVFFLNGLRPIQSTTNPTTTFTERDNVASYQWAVVEVV